MRGHQFIRLLVVIFLCLNSFPGHAQTDQVGSGRALSFNGVNQYVNLGNIYDDLELPITISAWVKLDGNPGGFPIFASQDNSDLYNGFWFFVTPNIVLIEIGDGFGNNLSSFRRGKTASVTIIPNQWHHICAVMRSPSDVDLYVNGINVGGSDSGDSNFPMSSNFPADVAKIGYFFSNGINYWFKGMMDDVRLYNIALTQNQIRATMCKKLTGSETGLIGHWDFNETTGNTILDKSANGFNGTLINSPSRIYSGAPIGDESVFLYPANWAGTQLTMNESGETVTVSNVTAGSHGVHTYVVRNAPTQSGGLNLSISTPPYFGVFVAGIATGQMFDVAYSTGQCVKDRIDNSFELWNDRLLDDITNRLEFIRSEQPTPITANLGVDETLCPFTPRTLQPVANPAGYTFLWQDGSTQSTYSPTSYGTYWVTAKRGCSIDRDSITFTRAEKTHLAFDFGVDKVICPMPPTLLNPLSETNGFTFKWQDGSSNTSFTANDYGKYWVSITSECNIGSDTIRFIKAQYVLDVDLGEDISICPLPPVTLRPLPNPTGYQFKWQDESSKPELTVSNYGKYWVSVTSDCAIGSDTIRFSKKEFADLFIPNIITPNDDGYNQHFIIGNRESGDQLLGAKLEIFNRWGKKVYSTANYQNNWAGEGLQSGIYYYLIQSECIGDKKGWLTIKR